MSGKESKTLQSKKPQIYQLQWYPSAIGCISTGKRKAKPKQMPPLMVRKAEWRR